MEQEKKVRYGDLKNGKQKHGEKYMTKMVYTTYPRGRAKVRTEISEIIEKVK